MRSVVPVLSLLLAFGQAVCAETSMPSANVEPDVMYVPTPQPVVEEMLRLAELSSRDLLYDLGSGDGRIVITAAARYGARGVGIDIDPVRIAESNVNARQAGVSANVKFIQGDLFATDLRPATAVTLYLLRSLNLRLRPKLLSELRPGTPVISHDFHMGEWEPDATVAVGDSTLYMWRVPADLRGDWEITLREPDHERRLVLRIDQAFQKVSGFTAAEGAVGHALTGRLNGEQLELTLVPNDDDAVRVLKGSVRGGVMKGRIIAGDKPGIAVGSWSARRIAMAMQMKLSENVQAYGPTQEVTQHD